MRFRTYGNLLIHKVLQKDDFGHRKLTLKFRFWHFALMLSKESKDTYGWFCKVLTFNDWVEKGVISYPNDFPFQAFA